MWLRQRRIVKLNLHVDEVGDTGARYFRHLLRCPYAAADCNAVSDPANIHVLANPSLATFFPRPREGSARPDVLQLSSHYLRFILKHVRCARRGTFARVLPESIKQDLRQRWARALFFLVPESGIEL